MEKKKIYWWRTLASFILVLFTMPLGHALMILMEKFMQPEAVHYAGFMMGFAGLVMVIIGVFVKGDTRQTLWDSSAACSSGPAGWSSSFFIMPAATACSPR